MKASPVYLQAMSCLSALGADPAAMRAALFADAAPCTLTRTDACSPGQELELGGLPPDIPLLGLDHLPAHLRSRNNAVALTALQPLRKQIDRALERFGATRLAVIVGTSTSGILEGEKAAAYLQQHQQFPDSFNYAIQEMGNVAGFLAMELGTRGPAYVISTACSSGAKALATGARLLRANIVDAVVAGGVDTLSPFTVAGFSALESVSAGRCNPSSLNRCGINLGEGAAFFLMGRDSGPIRLAGWGESQDAHHMSAPDPSGRGAIVAMRQALERAGIQPDSVDYLNLHGTATPHNDAMEHLAVHTVFGDKVRASSTKPLTGHALAAAGAIEGAIAWQVLCENPDGYLPPHWWDGAADPALPALQLVTPGHRLGRPPEYVMSNSFAFGGNNVSLLFAAT